jgi:ABC-type uncharacterized transport system permease subunit
MITAHPLLLQAIMNGGTDGWVGGWIRQIIIGGTCLGMGGGILLIQYVQSWIVGDVDGESG